MVIVVAVIAILAVVAVPGLMRYEQEAMRAEANLGLGLISRMQHEHYYRFRRFAYTLDEVGFLMDRGQSLGPNLWQGRYYKFSLIIPDMPDAQRYQGLAIGNLDGDAFQDVLFVSW